MHTSLFLIATALSYVTATPAPQATSTPPTGPFFLGSPCAPSSSQCLGGAQCYAVNSMQIPTCGNFQAACTSDAQCATNTCVTGFCSGPVAPTLPLGTMCYQSTQCAGGASCYAVNSMLIPRCGNFQAVCTVDAQCAYNTCVGGFCAGVLSSSSTGPATATSVSAVSTSSVFVLTTAAPSGTGVGTSTVVGNSTVPTGTPTPKVIIQGGAGEKLQAQLGCSIMAFAAAFAFLLAF